MQNYVDFSEKTDMSSLSKSGPRNDKYFPIVQDIGIMDRILNFPLSSGDRLNHQSIRCQCVQYIKIRIQKIYALF